MTASEKVVRLLPMSLATLRALDDRDLDRAGDLAKIPLPAYFVTDECHWLWAVRLEQVTRDPASAEWVVRAAVTADGTVVGHAGFHGPPDENGMVEVAYNVDPLHRRQGYARAMLRALLAWAGNEPAVRTVRASVSPANAASLATIAGFGFVEVGEQFDEEDGLELLFEVPAH